MYIDFFSLNGFNYKNKQNLYFVQFELGNTIYGK